MGAVILPLLGLYLALLIWATVYGYRWAGKKGWQGRKRWLGAMIGFLIVYLPLFWDWIPTVVMHRYYCEIETGFWVYKTLDQWKKENPGVMETLVANKVAPSRYERFNDGHGETHTYLLNDRFNWIIIKKDISGLLPIMRTEQEVKDVKKNEVLARYVNFATGNSIKNTVGPPGPLKFWLHSGKCIGGERNQGLMYLFEHSVKGAE